MPKSTAANSFQFLPADLPFICFHLSGFEHKRIDSHPVSCWVLEIKILVRIQEQLIRYVFYSVFHTKLKGYEEGFNDDKSCL